MQADEEDLALKYDVWAAMSVQYALRVMGLRTEFYKISADDLRYAKMILPGLEKRGIVATADDLEEPLEKLERHMATQLTKAVAAQSASNATKRPGKEAPRPKSNSQDRASSLEKYAVQSRSMALSSLFRISMPSNSVRDS